MINFINTASAHADEVGSFGGGMMNHFNLGFNSGGMSFGWIIMILFWGLLILSFILLINNSTQKKKTQKKVKKEKLYICTECGYEYKERKWAIKCQNWCRDNKSCNLEIIKHGKPGV